MKKTQIRFFTLSFLSLLLSSCDEGKLSETKTIYFANSEQVKQIVEYKNGKKNGSLKEYYRNGNLKAVQRYLNDTLNDTSFFYHENGNRGSIQIYKNNQKTSCWQKYNKSGKLYWEACFKKNDFDGTCLQYSYRNLKLIERLNYKEGQKHGKQESFYNNGKPRSVSYYDKGEALSGTEEWLENGKKLNTDFKIIIQEQNEVLLKNKLSFTISLQNQQEDDKLFEEYSYDSDKNKKFYLPIKKTGNVFVIAFDIPKGGFVMKDVKLLAKRKTSMGNIIMKRSGFVAAANNF